MYFKSEQTYKTYQSLPIEVVTSVNLQVLRGLESVGANYSRLWLMSRPPGSA